MSAFKDIRQKLKATQQELADCFGCTQGNVALYDKGQTVPPETAKKLIEFARTKGVPVTFEDIYGNPDGQKGGKPAQRGVVRRNPVSSL